MERDVFIIHAHKDKSIADAICGKLESAGLKCWIPTPETSPGEDRAQTTRNAIGSSHVIVLVLSENANTATHIGKEIACAFYTRRIIIPFRLGETLPRREYLFYLGNGPWINAVSPPAEEHLEALSARIKGLLPGSAVAGNALTPQGGRTTMSTLSFSNSWVGDLRASLYRTLGILKWTLSQHCFVRWGRFCGLASAKRKKERHWQGTPSNLCTVVPAFLRLNRLRLEQTQPQPPHLRVSACGRRRAMRRHWSSMDHRIPPPLRQQSGRPT
jgi:hypothetical protein